MELRQSAPRHPAPPAGRTDDQALLRTVLGSFATGVTVVTVGGRTPHGMTANSFASVSLDPPLALVCIRREATMHQAIIRTGSFAISVLASDQEGAARFFADAGRPAGARQFEHVESVEGACTGAPLICGALAWLECELWRTYDGGDHSIFVGRLISLGSRDAEGALLFLGGRFQRFRVGQ
jgi:flavin reductase